MFLEKGFIDSHEFDCMFAAPCNHGMRRITEADDASLAGLGAHGSVPYVHIDTR